ncbi:MAG: 50S ribosomal protein L31 [Mycoplasmataceae bacterium]|jgi:large subunit ribosomal protein L31|nr:50S ribosomal protein L31 [Mycoplasmataceae bacterium]
MKKEIHPKTQLVKFKCASCGSEYDIVSTNKQALVNIDVCSNCHLFYKNASGDKKSKGRAEKLSNKFNVGKQVMEKPKVDSTSTNTKKKSAKKVITSLEDF